MSEPQKTQEQLDNEAIAFAEAQSVSARFCLRHPDFKKSPENANKMKELLDAAGKNWTGENLDAVYVANLDAFKKNDTYVPPDVIPETPPEPELPYWGMLKTRRDIDAIDRTTYKAWLKDPKFEAAVNAVLARGAR
jgi:hypothetical protein